MNDDQLLISKAQDGDSDAFRDLVEKYKKIVYYFAYDLTSHHEDAEDLSQEVFCRTYQYLESFRGECKFTSWLYKITANTFISQTRKRNFKLLQKRESLEVSLKLKISTEKNPEEKTESTLLKRHIDDALQTLSDKERVVFTMKHFHELKIKEIAETLNLSAGTVKSLLFRAVRKMQKCLAFYKKDMVESVL